MRISSRGILVALIALGLAMAVAPTSAFAQDSSSTPTTHKAKHHHPAHKHKTKSTHKKSKAVSNSHALRDAQTHLLHLGYYSGHPDGMMGPKTASGLKAFQRDNHLKVTGTLTNETRKALMNADKAHLSTAEAGMAVSSKPRENFYAAHPDFYGHTDQQYADPLALTRGSAATPAQTLPNRFAQVSLNEENRGAVKRYTVTVNDHPVLQADNQPSVIGVSSTYQIGQEDAIILSTFNPDDASCAYKHFLLTLKSDGNQLRAIDNCTREYKAGVTYDSLIISFPENDDHRAVGSTWRYDNGDLEKL